MRPIIAFFAAMLLAAASFAAEPAAHPRITIDEAVIPQPLEVNEYAWLNIEDIDPKTAADDLEVICPYADVEISPPAQWLTAEGGVFILFRATKVGQYKVTVIACSQPKDKRRTAVTITVGEGPFPDPNPDPAPDPDPTPDPAPGAKWVVFVFEAANNPAWVAALKNSPSIFSYCQSKGHQLRWIERHQDLSKTPTLEPYRELALKNGLPWLLVTQKGWKGLGRAPPQTAEEVLALLKSVDAE